MKLGLTEKQYNRLLNVVTEIELGEQAEPPPSEPETGTSGKQAGGQGYPQVGKWESGATRGPGNQVGVTKWADVVGSKLTRGKGNQLKEQMSSFTGLNPILSKQSYDKFQNDKEDKERKDFLKTKNAKIFNIPPGFKYPNTILIPLKVGSNTTKVSYFGDPSKTLQLFFKNWDVPEYEKYVPSVKQIEEILPPNTLRSFTVNNINYVSKIKRISDKPVFWKFIGYYDDLEHSYKEQLFFNVDEIPESLKYDELSFWQNWGSAILLVAGVASSIFIPGSTGLWVGLGLDLASVTNSLYYKDNLGAAIGLVCAFLPFISIGLKIGDVSVSQARRLTNAIKFCENEKEIVDLINGVSKTPAGRLLTNQDRYILQKLKDIEPEEISKLINSTILERIKIIKKSSPQVSDEKIRQMYETIQDLYKQGKINKAESVRFYKTFGFESVSLFLGTLVGISYLQTLGKTIESIEYIKNGTSPLTKQFFSSRELYYQVLENIEKLDENTLIKFDEQMQIVNEKFYSICEDKFKDEGEGSKIRFYSISTNTMKKFMENPNLNLDVIANGELNKQIQDYESNK